MSATRRKKTNARKSRKVRNTVRRLPKQRGGCKATETCSKGGNHTFGTGLWADSCTKCSCYKTT